MTESATRHAAELQETRAAEAVAHEDAADARLELAAVESKSSWISYRSFLLED